MKMSLIAKATQIAEEDKNAVNTKMRDEAAAARRRAVQIPQAAVVKFQPPSRPTPTPYDPLGDEIARMRRQEDEMVNQIQQLRLQIGADGDDTNIELHPTDNFNE